MIDTLRQLAKEPTFLLSRVTRTISSAIPLFAVFSLLSALAFATRSIVTKAGSVHMPLPALILMPSALSLPILGGIAWWTRTSLRPNKVPVSLYGWRVIWGLTTTVFMFASLKLMPATLASTLGYTTPLFLALLAPVFLKEKSTTTVLLLTLVGFAGISLNAMPYLGNIPSWAIVVGLLTGLTGAFMQIYIRKLASAGESGLRGVFWMHATSATVGLIACAVTGSWDLSRVGVEVCFVIAVLSCAAQILNSSAYAHGTALPVNALSLVTLPLTVVMATVFLAEKVSFLAILGIGIVLPSCFLLVWVETGRLRKAHRAHGSLTVADLQEEHAQVQTAFSPGCEPLYVSEPTASELTREGVAPSNAKI